MLHWINTLMALIFLTVIIFCIPDPQGTEIHRYCPKCFSGGCVPVTGWSAGNKFTDVLMAESWDTKEWWIRALGHWQNNKVYLFGVLHSLVHGATNADPKKAEFEFCQLWSIHFFLKCLSLPQQGDRDCTALKDCTGFKTKNTLIFYFILVS